ncbi:MAG: transglycosylase SLT domain-containing protein [Bacteroidota bacterium]|jgi:hypothetical protein
MQLKRNIFLFTVLAGILSLIGLKNFSYADKEISSTTKKNSNPDVIQLKDTITKEKKFYIHDKQIYDLRCDTFSQIKFWRKIMNLPKDTGLISVANSRIVLLKLDSKSWDKNSEDCKEEIKSSIKTIYCVPDSVKLFFTAGKNYFYDFNKVYPSIHEAIKIFQDNETDPWYAQAILLIESPNKLQKSSVGAYGPFQLMPFVAKKFGLIVSRKRDERADLARSAYCASKVIKEICIPKIKETLDTLSIPYNEKDLWFRCLVMHAYHAGIGNVRPAIEACGTREPGMGLLKKLWQTQAKAFRNSSQAYSQLAIAAMLEMDARVKIEELK